MLSLLVKIEQQLQDNATKRINSAPVWKDDQNFS